MKVQLGMSEEITLWPEEKMSIGGGPIVEMDEAKYKECLAIQKTYEEMQGYLLTLENEARDKERKNRNES